MKKNTKAALKSIVKECLIELLAEGLSGEAKINESKSLKSTFNKISNSNNNQRYLNNVKKDIDNSKTFNEDRINETVSKITKDDVMSQILADTARTTLVAQGSSSTGSASANIMASGDAAAKASLQSDPMELFSESAGKWANLAFSGPLTKK